MARHAREVPASSKPNRRARIAHSKARKEFTQYDTSYIRPKKSKAPVVVAGIIAVAIIAIFCTLVMPRLFAFGSNVGDLPANETATVTIESGNSAGDVAKKFEDARLVKSSSDFAKELDNTGAAASLIPGNYTFNGQTPTATMAERLKNGERDGVPSVTVVEGYTIKSIASAIEKSSNGRITADDFINETSDASKFAADFAFLSEVGTNSLEGFLFPKTYEIEDTDTANTMVVKMLNQFSEEVSSLSFSYPSSKGLSVYQAINLASIVQKEANASTYARVAGVFYNRLASDSPYLQSDATTAYVVGHDPTADEVHANDPYSTYSNSGLPPTPISNPCLDCIKAVCNPEETNYQYFYTNKDGSYVFSTTYEEHQAAIEQDNK